MVEKFEAMSPGDELPIPALVIPKWREVGPQWGVKANIQVEIDRLKKAIERAESGKIQYESPEFGDDFSAKKEIPAENAGKLKLELKRREDEMKLLEQDWGAYSKELESRLGKKMQ